MAFTISIPLSSGTPLTIVLQPGEQLYILGANGTGKSSLVHRINSSNSGMTRHVSAHRQNWFASSELTLSSQQKRQTETNIMQADLQPYARWRDDYSSQRAGIALYDLVAVSQLLEKVARASKQGVWSAKDVRPQRMIARGGE